MDIPTPEALTLEVDAIRAAQIDAECDNIIRVIRSRWPSPVKDCRLLSPPPSEMFAEIIRRFAAKVLDAPLSVVPGRIDDGRNGHVSIARTEIELVAALGLVDDILSHSKPP